MTRKTIRVLLLAAVVVVVNSWAGAAIAAPRFITEATITSNTGYAQLTWEPENGPVELQQALDQEFSNPQTIYQGNNTSLFISGLRNGAYFYRLQATDGTLSPPLTLEVQHYPLGQAWMLFALGAGVFAGIVFVILNGEQHQHE
ncbi:MAG: hypothetical protein HC835_18465 [Oscillatoriales cyanobacterium RM2_1_1]|nr:hypothetical protein [Oscillatoriales cyanobacterium SM2_3_0]NJO47429.1 hypothetical protein [Oscillatoriales cyanobacterium RM2_1_1]